MPKSTACARCGEERHYTGSRWRCSRCYNEWQTNRRQNFTPEQRDALREVEIAQAAARRAAWTPEKRAAVNAYTQAWRDADPQRHRAGARDWYERNLEYARAAKRAEYYREPEKFYAQNLIRKARINDAVCAHGPKCVTAEVIKALYDQDCLYCGQPAEAADHFNPLARGGLHCVENLVPSCQSCNSRKSAREPIEFLLSVGILIPR